MLDDGRGRSRTSIMKHRHEIESGRTSTATTHLMGFRSTGQAIVGRDTIRANKRKGDDEIAREAYRVITLMDLAGHEKYLKTTYVFPCHQMSMCKYYCRNFVSQLSCVVSIHGVSSGFADYALILVNSRQPPTHMTLHHLNLCCSFGIPVIVVFTKIDGCPDHAFKTCKVRRFTGNTSGWPADIHILSLAHRCITHLRTKSPKCCARRRYERNLLLSEMKMMCRP